MQISGPSPPLQGGRAGAGARVPGSQQEFEAIWNLEVEGQEGEVVQGRGGVRQGLEDVWRLEPEVITSRELPLQDNTVSSTTP